MTMLDDHMAEILLSPAQVLAAVTDHDRRSALLAIAVRRLETSGDYATGGAVSINAWLREHARMTHQRAGELVSTGRFLDTYPAFAEAAVSGRLSGSQIDIARRLNRHKYATALAAHQSELVELLAAADITVTVKLVDHWRTCADAVADDEATPGLEPVCELMFGRTLDNELHGTLNLHDAAATEFEKAINNAITHDGDDETRSLTERQGDALFDIAAFFNKNHTGVGTPRHLPAVSLSADISTVITNLPEGVNDDTQQPMSPACTATYLCDCRIHVILREADTNPAKFGVSTYIVPRALFRQVAARDGGCRFPGCNRPVRFTDAHHIHHWQHGGATDYHNLLLLCSRHHHYVHQQRLIVKLEPNATAHFTWHHGQHRHTTPRGAPPTRQQPQPPSSG